MYLWKDFKYCSECESSGYNLRICTKNHLTTSINGYQCCEQMVNFDWYISGIKCEDFKQRIFDDPSGS